MSVLHICCNLAGTSVFHELFEALAGQGLEQVVFVPEKREENLGKNEPLGVETHSVLTVRRSDSVLFFRKAQRTVPEILRRVDMQGVRLLHAHTLMSDGSVALRLHRQLGLPYVATLRYSDEVIWRWEMHLRPLAREIFREAERVVFLSERVRERVLGTWFGEEERASLAARTQVIPNGIAGDWLGGEARAYVGDTVRVGFAGQLSRRKRPLDALAAVHEANDRGGRGYVLRAVGAGPLEEPLKAALREDDRYLGRAQGIDAMKRFYRSCDVLLVPSAAETFGMVYLEAMSQGVPVIYTRGQGFDGQFPEGEIGYAAACGDIREQADRLIQIVDGYAERSRRCVSGAASYAWPVVAQRWLALYAGVV